MTDFELDTAKPLKVDICGNLRAADGFLHHGRCMDQHVLIVVLKGSLHLLVDGEQVTEHYRFPQFGQLPQNQRVTTLFRQLLDLSGTRRGRQGRMADYGCSLLLMELSAELSAENVSGEGQNGGQQVCCQRSDGVSGGKQSETDTHRGCGEAFSLQPGISGVLFQETDRSDHRTVSEQNAAWDCEKTFGKPG